MAGLIDLELENAFGRHPRSIMRQHPTSSPFKKKAGKLGKKRNSKCMLKAENALIY